MNDKYLKIALEKIPDKRALIHLASKRAKELAKGERPLLRTEEVNHLDIALLEISEGLLNYELPIEDDFDDFLS
ncbi:MAG TPA: DNA-directed RNA polymerase subunit omega [Victivallales bacterium]|nr:DNA-directed RNA polymerase subunit omega [Victivallales bacterium]